MTSCPTPQGAAQEAAEAVRQLNHLLNAVEAVTDAYDIVGALSSCLDRIPQTLTAIEGWLMREQRAGRLRLRGSGDVDRHVRRVSGALVVGAVQAMSTAIELRAAQRALADLYGPVAGEGKEENGQPMPTRRLALEVSVGRPLSWPADEAVGGICAHCAHGRAAHWLYAEDGDDEPWSWCDECGGRCEFVAFGLEEES